MNLKPWKTIKAAGLALVMIGVWVAWLGEPALAATSNKVLILGSTVVGGTDSLEATQARALDYEVEVASDADWAGKTAENFANYKAIVLGDFGCAQDDGPVAAAVANRITWTPAVTGNVIVIGTAAAFYSGMGTAGATKLVTDGIAFAAAGATTGAYISLNCYYSRAGAGTTVRVLDQFGPSIGTFTVEGVVGTGSTACDRAHIVATLPSQLADLTDADLSGWFCSVHEGFVAWPQSSFSVLAILQGFPSASGFVAPDGTTGAPYIVARTSTIQPPTNQPPVCTGAVASPSTLQAPDRQFVAISITGVTDPNGDAVTITAASISQDEPVTGGPAGNLSPDATLSPLAVRAESDPTGDGRVYHISFTADDGHGGTCTGSVNVCVPKNPSAATCVDGGSQFDSLIP
jgi:hypothetical protein